MKKFLSLVVALIFLLSANPVPARSTHFRTFTVVEVTETGIVLQALTGEKVEIARSRRPELQVGDRIRFERSQNRLGQPLAPGAPESAEESDGY